MNTNQLAHRIHRRLGITIEQAEKLVKVVAEEIATALTSYDSVVLFGAVALRPVVVPERSERVVPIPPECPICGEQGYIVRANMQHLRKAHGLTYEQFIEQYPVEVEKIPCQLPPIPRIMTSIRPELLAKMTDDTNEIWQLLRRKPRNHSSRKRQIAAKSAASRNGGYNAAAD